MSASGPPVPSHQAPELRRRWDEDALRRVFAAFPTGVTAVCALVNGEPVGLTANSFTAVSLEPALVSVCVRQESATWRRLRGATQIGVSVLSEAHAQQARQLAGPEPERFAGVDWYSDDDGAVTLGGAAALLTCRAYAAMPAGDHFIVLLEVLGGSASEDGRPLLFHNRRFRQLEC